MRKRSPRNYSIEDTVARFSQIKSENDSENQDHAGGNNSDCGPLEFRRRSRENYARFQSGKKFARRLKAPRRFFFERFENDRLERS